MKKLLFFVPPVLPGQALWYYGVYAAGLSFMIVIAATYVLIIEEKHMKLWYFLGCSIGIIFGVITTYYTINRITSIITCIALITCAIIMYKKFKN